MSLGFQHHPEGMSGNSPALQRWVRVPRLLSPERTAESDCSTVPSGLMQVVTPKPNAEALGYCRMSLRDTETNRTQ
jgi:hypothetical protein